MRLGIMADRDSGIERRFEVRKNKYSRNMS